MIFEDDMKLKKETGLILAMALAIVSSTLLAGCGVSAEIIDVSDLHPPTTKTKFHLAENYSYLKDNLYHTFQWKVTIDAGDYVAEFQDGQGTYYRGPKNCFHNVAVFLHPKENETPVASTLECGIFLPLSRSALQKVYVYLPNAQDAAQQGQSAVDALTVQQIVASPKPVSVGAAGAAGAVGGVVGYLISRTANDPRFMGEIHQPEDNALRDKIELLPVED
jgi:hypothetical protein